MNYIIINYIRFLIIIILIFLNTNIKGYGEESSLIPKEIIGAKDEIITKADNDNVTSKKTEFHGLFYMMRWVDSNYHQDVTYVDSYMLLSYEVMPKTGIKINIDPNDILYSYNKWGNTEVFGYIDLLSRVTNNDYSLVLKLGKVNKKNEYFGEYAMGIGKDFITLNRINVDPLNWQVAFIVNNQAFPFEWNITSDLDAAKHIFKNKQFAFGDNNDEGFSLINEMLIRELEVTTKIKYSLSVFYSEQFFAVKNRKVEDNLDVNNRTTYGGLTSKLLWQGEPISFSIGGALKHFDIKKIDNQTKEGFDSEMGFWVGNYKIADFKAAFQRINENKIKPQDTLGLETNFYMIPKLTPFAGLAIALEGNIKDFYNASTFTNKARYGWDFGVMYAPASKVLLTTGWQKMVRFDDIGYLYIKTSFWW